MSRIFVIVSLSLLLTRSSLSQTWKPFLPPIEVKMIAFGWQGGMYAISTNDELYFLKLIPLTRYRKWIPILPNVRVKFVDIHPDGTVFALSAVDHSEYVRTNGKWEHVPVIVDTANSFEQVVRTKSGRQFSRLGDNRVCELYASCYKEKFIYISHATELDLLYLIGTDNRIYASTGTSEGGLAGELAGKGKGKVITGKGPGFRGAMFVIGAGTDSNVYFFDITPTGNKWTLLPGNGYMRYISLNPSGRLFGIGVDNKIYYFEGAF